MIMLYSQIRSGQIQVESLGAAFICLYILTISKLNVTTVKPYSLPVIAAAFFAMCGVMFKEPFVLIAIATALLFITNWKDLFFKLILPLIYGGLLGVLLMTLTGTLVPYLTVYLPHMVGNHVSIHGSPWQRGIHIEYVIHDIGNFSSGLQMVIILLFACLAFCLVMKSNNEIGQKKNPVCSILRLLKIPLMIYLVSFSVGLGGQYYNHHFVFAVPFYIGLFIFALEKINGIFSKNLDINIERVKGIAGGFVATVLVLTCCAFYLLPDYEYDQTVLDANPVMRQQAQYIDGLLDYYGVDRYQYLGFNGNLFYGFTKHSPLGPLFTQDPNNFQQADTWFTKNMLLQMEKAEILIVDRIEIPVLNDVMEEIISDKFTNTPWDLSYTAGPPEEFDYTIYYRIK